MLRSLKRLIKRAARAFGYDIVEYRDQHSLSRHLAALFAKLNVGCVIDVGAHVGEYGLFLRRLGYQGHIVSLEPVAANYAALVDRIRGDGRWRARRLALGAGDGTMPINVSSSTDFSSFLNPNAYAAERFGPRAEVQRTELVEVRRLDAILDELVAPAGPGSLYLKMDTQGYDLAVLEGAGASLPRFVALQTEVPVKPIYQGMTGLPEALDRLARLGFELSGMFPVTRDADGLRVIEFDCVMVRTPEGASRRETRTA